VSSTAPSRPAVIRLDSLLDAGRMTQHVVSMAASDGSHVSTARLLDHKPGRRALVVYELDGGGRVFGKAYADAGGAERSFEIFRRVHDALPGRVPQPIGVVADLALVLYQPLDGRPLDDFAGTDEMTDALGRAGAWLADLHGATVALDRTLDPVHEAENVGLWADSVATAEQGLAAEIAALTAELATEVPATVERAVPIHKDFHYQHVIVGADVGVVDLDEARMGDPAFDLAHFCANLHLLALRTGTGAAAEDGWLRAFLTAYAARSDWVPGTAFRWYTAYTFVKIAKQLVSGSGPRPRPFGEAQASEVTHVVREGLACLSR